MRRMGRICLSCFKGILIFPIEFKMHNCICTECGTRHKVRLYKKSVTVTNLGEKASKDELLEMLRENRDFFQELLEKIKEFKESSINPGGK